MPTDEHAKPTGSSAALPGNHGNAHDALQGDPLREEDRSHDHGDVPDGFAAAPARGGEDQAHHAGHAPRHHGADQRAVPAHGHEHGRLEAGGPGALRVVALSSVALGLVAVVELVTAAVSSSAAVLADGLHNLGDVSTTLALAAAFLLSRRAPSRRFPYGYHRGEDLAGLVVLVLIIASALASGVTSIEHLVHRQPPTHLVAALVAALVGLVGNEAVARYKTTAGRRIGSATLVADGQHSRVDGLASLGAALGVVGAMLGVPLLDPIAGLGITAVIGVVAWDTAKNVTGRLLDEADASLLELLTEVAAEVPEVLGVTETRARWTGRRVYAELTLELTPTATLAAAHTVGEEVRHRLHHRVASLADVVVHLDPAGMAEAHRAVAHHRTGG
ncbi:MAG: cation diffusion facilitator family transporter [Candidatus Dormibacteria bacterium]